MQEKTVTAEFENYKIDYSLHENGLSVNFQVRDLEDSDDDLFLEGFIKWDGCFNVDFNTANCMAHFCGRDGLSRFNSLLNKLYDISAEQMPKHQEHLK